MNRHHPTRWKFQNKIMATKMHQQPQTKQAGFFLCALCVLSRQFPFICVYLRPSVVQFLSYDA